MAMIDIDKNTTVGEAELEQVKGGPAYMKLGDIKGEAAFVKQDQVMGEANDRPTRRSTT